MINVGALLATPIRSAALTMIFSGLVFFSYGQVPLSTLPSGGNKKASVSEWVGLTRVEVDYSRPGVRGRAGHIWGQLVHVGFVDQGFGSSKASPWRAGANENTVIRFSTDVRINGQPLAAGAYGFFIAYYPDSAVLIFSKESNAWGSYFYNPASDALRVSVRPEKLEESVERLRFQFSEQTEQSAVLALEWERLRIPFTVDVDYVATQLASFRRELLTERGFVWQSWEQAGAWCAERKVNLPQALEWSDSACSATFGGDQFFTPFVTRAALLELSGRQQEAADVIRRALPKAGMQEAHSYARRLLMEKKTDAAMEVFEANFKKYPNQFTTLVGMTRGLAAKNEWKKALLMAKKALPMAPDTPNREAVQAMIKKLEQGQSL